MTRPDCTPLEEEIARMVCYDSFRFAAEVADKGGKLDAALRMRGNVDKFWHLSLPTARDILKRLTMADEFLSDLKLVLGSQEAAGD